MVLDKEKGWPTTTEESLGCRVWGVKLPPFLRPFFHGGVMNGGFVWCFHGCGVRAIHLAQKINHSWLMVDLLISTYIYHKKSTIHVTKSTIVPWILWDWLSWIYIIPGSTKTASLRLLEPQTWLFWGPTTPPAFFAGSNPPMGGSFHDS